MSLGAQRDRLLQLMVFDGLRLCPALFSLGRGLLLSCVATRAFLLSGTRPLDPVGLSGVIATLLALMPPERQSRVSVYVETRMDRCALFQFQSCSRSTRVLPQLSFDNGCAECDSS
jgi:hypothetical protein